jgi:hypothetical protein
MRSGVAVAADTVIGCVWRQCTRTTTVSAMDTITYELEAGQSLLLTVRRGDQLWVRRGRLLAQARARWLGESLLVRQAHWLQSQAWVADEGEHWHCRAVAPTTLVLQRQRGRLRRLVDLIARAARVLRPPAVPRPRRSAAAARCAETPAR